MKLLFLNKDDICLMSVEDSSVIDFVSIDLEGNAVLTISDHLEWDDDNEHLLILQNKINAYLQGIENGSLLEKYPSAKHRKMAVAIIAKYAPDKIATEFIARVKIQLETAGYGFNFKVNGEI